MKWRAFSRKRPPDNLRVLVTNNLKARDFFGQMSHLWIGWPQQSDGPTESFPRRPEKGTWLVYTDGGSEAINLTHWLPLPTVSGWKS